MRWTHAIIASVIVVAMSGWFVHEENERNARAIKAPCWQIFRAGPGSGSWRTLNQPVAKGGAFTFFDIDTQQSVTASGDLNITQTECVVGYAAPQQGTVHPGATP